MNSRTRESRPSSRRSPSTKCGLGRKRTSKTRSASKGTPCLKPKETRDTASPERVEQVREVLALAHVHAEGHPVDRALGAGHQVGEGRDQRGGQVVDAEEAHVLEALDRVALAGAAEAGDDDEGDRLSHAQARRRRSVSAPAWAPVAVGGTAGSPALRDTSRPCGAQS